VVVPRSQKITLTLLGWLGAGGAFTFTFWLLNVGQAVVEDVLPPKLVVFDVGGFVLYEYVLRAMFVGVLLGSLAGGLSGVKSAFPVGSVLYNVTRTILNTLRSIEPLIMGLVFVIWVGIGPFAGVLALTLHSIASLGKLHGFEVSIVPPVESSLNDQSIVTVSSTIIRWLVQHGRVADAARLLGRPYTITGTVVQGDQRGRQIGFPTANLSTPCLLPADAVYAGVAQLVDGRRFNAAIHVGVRSTFDDTTRTLEAYILDWKGPLAEGGAEYHWPLRLEITHWLRDQARFDSVSSLVDQIGRDVSRTRTLVNA